MPAGIGWANIGKQRICTSKHRLLTANPLWRAKPTGQKKPTPERVAEWAYTQQVSHGTHWVLILLAFGVIVILATGIYNHTIITDNLIRAGVGQLCRADFFLCLRCGHGFNFRLLDATSTPDDVHSGRVQIESSTLDELLCLGAVLFIGKGLLLDSTSGEGFLFFVLCEPFKVIYGHIGKVCGKVCTDVITVIQSLAGRKAVTPHGSKYGVVVDVRSGSVPDEECMHVPRTTSLRFDNTDVLRAGVALLVVPVEELLPKLLEIVIQLLSVGHVLGICEGHPTHICGSGYVRIDQSTNASKRVPDGTCTLGAVVDMGVLQYFSGASVDVVVSIQLDRKSVV